MAMTTAEKRAFDTLRNASAILVAAYRKGMQSGGSVEWEDVNEAWQLAKRGLREAREVRGKR